MRSPILGGFSVSRSTNLSDSKCINLFPTILDTKDGKAVGALYMCPGLDLLATAGGGPIRGVYDTNIPSLPFVVVSGNGVYGLPSSLTPLLLGTIATSSGPVSISDNGIQCVIFDGFSGYLVPGGYPLTGGTIGSGGTQYAAGDTINLTAAGGSQTATAIITVTTVSVGVVTGFRVTQAGAFPTKPASFTQNSTDGSGSGFTLTGPAYGAFVGVVPVALPFDNPLICCYIDGFILCCASESNRIWQCNYLDASIWDPLNFAVYDADAENVVTLLNSHDQLYVITGASAQLWINAGTAGFAFAPQPSAHLETGCAAPFSAVKVGESVVFLTRNEQGQGLIAEITGYQLRFVSTQAIANQIASYPTCDDAVAYSYQQGGRVFYVISFPSGDATWCLDVTDTAMAGYPVWHQRAAFSNGQLSRHWGNCHDDYPGVVQGKRAGIIGDYRNGNLYAFNMDTLTDNGSARKWVRSWRALERPKETTTRFSSLRLDMEAGAQVPEGTTPNVVFRWSDDGGHSWSNERIVPLGPLGDTAWYAQANRLGSTRRRGRSDRIFEASSTDSFKVAIVGAEVEAS